MRPCSLSNDGLKLALQFCNLLSKRSELIRSGAIFDQCMYVVLNGIQRTGHVCKPLFVLILGSSRFLFGPL